MFKRRKLRPFDLEMALGNNKSFHLIIFYSDSNLKIVQRFSSKAKIIAKNSNRMKQGSNDSDDKHIFSCYLHADATARPTNY